MGRRHARASSRPQDDTGSREIHDFFIHRHNYDVDKHDDTNDNINVVHIHNDYYDHDNNDLACSHCAACTNSHRVAPANTKHRCQYTECHHNCPERGQALSSRHPDCASFKAQLGASTFDVLCRANLRLVIGARPRAVTDTCPSACQRPDPSECLALEALLGALGTLCSSHTAPLVVDGTGPLGRVVLVPASQPLAATCPATCADDPCPASSTPSTPPPPTTSPVVTTASAPAHTPTVTRVGEPALCPCGALAAFKRPEQRFSRHSLATHVKSIANVLDAASCGAACVLHGTECLMFNYNPFVLKCNLKGVRPGESSRPNQRWALYERLDDLQACTPCTQGHTTVPKPPSQAVTTASSTSTPSVCPCGALAAFKRPEQRFSRHSLATHVKSIANVLDAASCGAACVLHGTECLMFNYNPFVLKCNLKGVRPGESSRPNQRWALYERLDDLQGCTPCTQGQMFTDDDDGYASSGALPSLP